LSVTKTRRQGRVAVSLPQRMVEAIDDLVKKHSDLFLNRQQFVESALREKIEKLKWK
jgi:metal-responsive CopG/Arc/MetJ family transcriptional regulator